jgi:hypothetical protein
LSKTPIHSLNKYLFHSFITNAVFLFFDTETYHIFIHSQISFMKKTLHFSMLATIIFSLFVACTKEDTNNISRNLNGRLLWKYTSAEVSTTRKSRSEFAYNVDSQLIVGKYYSNSESIGDLDSFFYDNLKRLSGHRHYLVDTTTNLPISNAPYLVTNINYVGNTSRINYIKRIRTDFGITSTDSINIYYDIAGIASSLNRYSKNSGNAPNFDLNRKQYFTFDNNGNMTTCIDSIKSRTTPNLFVLNNKFVYIFDLQKLAPSKASFLFIVLNNGLALGQQFNFTTSISQTSPDVSGTLLTANTNRTGYFNSFNQPDSTTQVSNGFGGGSQSVSKQVYFYR